MRLLRDAGLSPQKTRESPQTGAKLGATLRRCAAERPLRRGNQGAQGGIDGLLVREIRSDVRREEYVSSQSPWANRLPLFFPAHAIISANRHAQTSQARAHQGRAIQHVPGQGNNQARLYQSARSGSHPEHPQSRRRTWSLDLRTQMPRVRPSLRRQRQLHPQPQVPQVPGRPARPFPLASLSQLHRSPLRSTGFKFGRNAVRIPTAGRIELTWYTKRMLVASANFPSSAAPIPPNPNASPKKNPETVPTFPGTSSCAKTRMVENAEARISPITTLKIPVQNKFAYGSSSVNGIIPSSARNENQAMLRCPRGSTSVASSGPNADPALPPTWNSDCAMPCCPPEAMRATRDDSG